MAKFDRRIALYDKRYVQLYLIIINSMCAMGIFAQKTQTKIGGKVLCTKRRWGCLQF